MICSVMFLTVLCAGCTSMNKTPDASELKLLEVDDSAMTSSEPDYEFVQTTKVFETPREPMREDSEVKKKSKASFNDEELIIIDKQSKDVAETIKTKLPQEAEKTPEKIISALKPAAASVDMAVKDRTANILVADFNAGNKPNKLGGDFGSWDKDPNDKTQYCNMSFDDKVARGGKGYSLSLDYKVDSPNPAYNGIWMKLNGLDASKFTNLVFYIKGNPGKKFTDRFKIELKNKNEVGKCMVTGITSDWQKITIPLKDIKDITDLSSLTEFVIVFDDINATEKTGSINIDDICFE